ncbi:hypothetical protein [Janthinobacterium sp. MDT1-19]|uniref:hypothetical protein n=1 Tax=Janthinobacterium sp. MDT1-19 TaxID=1259339 RepID=UPI003F25032D
MTARPVATRPVLRRTRQIHKQIPGAGQLAGARERAPGRRRWHVQQLQVAAAHRGEGTCQPAGRSAHIHKPGSAVDQLASAVGAGSGDVLQLAIERCAR